ncbi:outer membrane protein assembly factor BamA [Pelagibacterales bacterium SAG-MED47]|nr:outer membrane protein assembly factor BamA [Pelagibacterales bacterium SAG-MED47]
MIKIIFTTLIIYFLNIAHSVSDEIKNIEISGNQRVNEDTIKIFGGISIGDDLDSNKLNEVLKKLYETNFFENIEIKFDESILKITVKENLIVQNLLIQGIKNKDLLKLVKSTILTKEKSPYQKNLIDKDIVKIKDAMQNVGYYFSSVNLLKKENNNNTIDLIFEIDLGEKAFINEISFVGNKKFKKRKLLNVITSEEDKFWKFISSKRLLNKQRLELDQRLLLNFYKDKGYYKASVLNNSVQFDNTDKFNVIFNIDSGKKFYFGDFKIAIPEDYDKKHFIKFEKNLQKFSGEKYSLRILEKMLNEIEKIATSKKYEFINARIDEKIVNKDKINITINILADENNYYVNKINILGNDITIEDVIRNELIVDEGDPLNKVLFNKSINNLKSLNIFEKVESEIVDTNNNFQKDINIKVEEKATGQISLGAGVGTSGTSTSFGVVENNFLGQGIRLDSNLFLSKERIKGKFSYIKSNYNNSDKDLILSVQSQEVDRLTNFGYKSNDTGFLLGTNYELLEDLYFKPNFSVTYETLTTASSASALLKKQEGSYFDTEVNYGLIMDKRNQSYQPSDGFLSSFYQTLPLNIEENQTLINGYELKTFNEYIEDQILTLTFFAKAANSLGDDDVKISDRLYMPSRKLRGFESGKVGPKDGEDYIGGNFLSAFNAKANLPVFPSFETIDFNIFYDAANVWGVDYDSSINDSSALRSSTGLGVDWYTPIGPLSFSFSQAITKKSSDKTESFRFNLGTTF